MRSAAPMVEEGEDGALSQELTQQAQLDGYLLRFTTRRTWRVRKGGGLWCGA
jgi:hypothetical protein